MFYDFLWQLVCLRVLWVPKPIEVTYSEATLTTQQTFYSSADYSSEEEGDYGNGGEFKGNMSNYYQSQIKLYEKRDTKLIYDEVDEYETVSDDPKGKNTLDSDIDLDRWNDLQIDFLNSILYFRMLL